PAGIDDEMVILDHSFRRNVHRFIAHVNNLVRLADDPALDELPRRRQLRSVTFGAAVIDPSGDHLLLFVGETNVVIKVAVCGVGVPGGHASLVDDLADHFAPAYNVVVAGHLEGPNPPFAVTLDTMVLEDARNLLAVCDLRLIVR